MNLTKLIQTHVDNHVQRFRHLDAHTKNIVKEIALPHIELHHLYANHPHESSFEPAEPIIDWLGELVAPLPKEIKENDLLKKKGVDMDEILAREGAEIAQVPLHLYFKADQLAATSEEKKQQMRVHYYENHWRQQISSKVDTNLRNIGSDLIKDPQVRFAAELNVFKQKLEEFVQLQHGKVQRLFEEGAISGEIQRALLNTITVQNIVGDSIEQEKAKQFGAAEAEEGRLVTDDEGVFFVTNLTGAQTSTALETLANTVIQTTGVTLEVANARAREMIRTTLNVGSLANTFFRLGGAAAAGSAAGLLLCNSMKAYVDSYYYTLIGVSTGAGLSIGILYSLYTICALEPPNFGGVTNFIDEGLNQMSEFMGTLDEYDVAQEKKEADISLDMFQAIGEEHGDAEEAAQMTEDQLVGAQAWVDNYIAQHEKIENLDDISSPDYTFQVRVGDKLLSLGTARARRDELFYKIGTIDGMRVHTFVSVNHEVKEYYVYEPFQGTRCIFTRLTMGKLISFVESLSPDQKDFVFQKFHHTIPLNYKMGERLSRLVPPEENAFMRREDNGVYYPANCVFNIIEQAESVEMLKGHKDNRDFESLLKKPEGSLLFRLFSGLIHYLKQTFRAGIGLVKYICELIWKGFWKGLKILTEPSGKLFISIVRYLTTDDIANMVDHIFSSVGGGIEDLLYNSYRHVLNFVDWVASNQTYLLIGNTICCIAAQTVVLTGAGFLFPGAAGGTSSYVMWKGVKLASQMMGMQIADAILTLLGSTGRWFNRILGNNSWLASFISKAVPDSMAPWIKRMINISTNLKTMIAPASTNALNIAAAKTAGGAVMVVFAAGVAYFAALPFAIPIGVAGGLLSFSGMFSSQMAAINHFPEAFQASASWFHTTAKNMLYALITSPYEGFASLFKSGANITYMQLLQPIWYIDILCQIFSSGFLGRNCRKVQKMFIKFWRRSFAARFIYGMFMDIVVLSGIDPLGIGRKAWSRGNCSGHLARIPINDYKQVKIYKWRTKHGKVIEFVVDADSLFGPRLRPKIVQVIIDNVSHDVTSELVHISDDRWSTQLGVTNDTTKTKWVIRAKPRFEYDDKNIIVLTKADQNFLGPDAATINEELEKLLNVWSDAAYQSPQGPIEMREDTIIMRDIEIQAELQQLTTHQHENYIVMDENGVTIAICKGGELRTAPISAYDTEKSISKEKLKSLKSWKLDRNAFKGGLLKIETEQIDGYEFANGYTTFTEDESTTIYNELTNTGGNTHRTDFALMSDKKGEAFKFDISNTEGLDNSDVIFKNGLDISGEKYRLLYVPEGNLLLDGRQLQWRTHEDASNSAEHVDGKAQNAAKVYAKSVLWENLQTLGDVIQERRETAIGGRKGQRMREMRARRKNQEEFLEDRSTRDRTRYETHGRYTPPLEEYETIERMAPMSVSPVEKPPTGGIGSTIASVVGLMATKWTGKEYIKASKDSQQPHEPKEVFVCGPNGRGGKDQCTVKVLKGDTYVSPRPPTSGPAPPGYDVPLDRNKRDGPMTTVPKALPAPPPKPHIL